MDTGHKLVYMANQIGDQAVAGIAEHIKKFWEPRMRKQMSEILAKPDHGLTPLVLEALQSLEKKAA
jgi:formate dehydrogenase subunit delta